MSNLTFKSIGAATVALNKNNSPASIALSCSTNNGEWTKYTVGNKITLNDGDTVAFSGANDHFSKNYSNYYYFAVTGTVEASGNIQSLMNFSDSCTSACYYALFSGCTGLTKAPQLSATTLAIGCYYNMFNGCTGLTDAPNLPATSLASSCYYWMFNKCTSLTGVQASLPATELAPYCYNHMFSGCTALTDAPNLPASTLAERCYLDMFAGCTSLTGVPATLPAITLADRCYTNMFSGCTALTDAPYLPATTLVNRCYYGMFQGCSSLTSINVELTAWNDSDSATTDWVSGVAASGTFAKSNSLPEEYGTSRIPTNWSISQYVEPDPFSGSLIFKSTGNTTVSFNKIGNPQSITIQYSKDGTNWSNVSQTISLSNNEIVAFSGNAKFSKNIQNRYSFSTGGQGTLAISGNIVSLVSAATIEDDYEFNSLFMNCKNIVDAKGISLPVNTKDWCYANMFFGCTALTAGPNLLAYSLADWCYSGMFAKCLSLSATPVINNLYLAPHCYSNMFQSCISLTSASFLGNEELEPWCYNSMFQGCVNLIASQSQHYLPAETLSTGCYSSMYRKCISTVFTPYLPTDTFGATNCYNFMFDRASKVDTVEVNFEQWPTDVTSCWLSSVAENGTFICPSALPTSVQYRNSHPATTFPSSWNVWNYQTMPLTFRTKDSALIQLIKIGTPQDITLYYSKNYKDWSPYPIGSSMVLKAGQHISFSGTTEYFSETVSNSDPADFYRFSTSGTTGMFVYGNIMTLVNSKARVNRQGMFAGLFYGCSGISDARRLNLPATVVSSNCYRAMFKGCTNLIYPPNVLPVTDVPKYAYREMFSGCTSLLTAPHIMATSLDTSSMEQMFRGCSSLQSIEVDFTQWYQNDSQTYAWVQDVAEDGTFTKPTALPTTYTHKVNNVYMYNWIPSGWTVVDK